MSFWKNLFGGGSKAQDDGVERVLAEEVYKGFVVKSIEMRVGSEYQLAGVIEKDVGGEARTYRFVRADRISDKEQLAALALAKGRQIVDEQGERMFAQG